MAAYAASKFALEAVTSVQRQELSKWGISVSSIEPGFMRTPLVVGTFTDLQAQSILPNVLPPIFYFHLAKPLPIALLH